MVWSNPYVGPSVRNNISFFLLSAYTNEELHTEKNSNIFTQVQNFRMKKVSKNQTQYHVPNKNIYQDQHLAYWKAPNKQSFRVKSAFKSCDHLFNS